jgi:hypothetical protein
MTPDQDAILTGTAILAGLALLLLGTLAVMT